MAATGRLPVPAVRARKLVADWPKRQPNI